MMMCAVECPREIDVIDAVTSGRWSNQGVASQSDTELRKHASGCAICSDLVEVAGALKDKHTTELRQANGPPASLMWWRSELRARREAVRKAASPISAVHAIAAACSLGVMVAITRPLYPTVERWLSGSFTRIGSFLPLEASEGFVSSAGSPLFFVALAALGCCFAVVPLAIYLILSNK